MASVTMAYEDAPKPPGVSSTFNDKRASSFYAVLPTDGGLERRIYNVLAEQQFNTSLPFCPRCAVKHSGGKATDEGQDGEQEGDTAPGTDSPKNEDSDAEPGTQGIARDVLRYTSEHSRRKHMEECCPDLLEREDIDRLDSQVSLFPSFTTSAICSAWNDAWADTHSCTFFRRTKKKSFHSGMGPPSHSKKLTGSFASFATNGP